MTSIIFDFDGTLVNSRACILGSLRFAFRQAGYDGIAFCKTSATQQDLQTTFKKTLKENGHDYSDEASVRFIDDYRWFHEEEGESQIELYDGVLSVLEELKKDFRLCIATTKHSMEVKRVIKKLGIGKYFHHIQGTDPGMRYKPEPDILIETLKHLNLPSYRTVYVGDSLHDMHAAQRAGMRRIGAAYGFAGSSSLQEHGPEWLIFDPKDLLEIRKDLLERLSRDYDDFEEGQIRVNSQSPQ